MYKLLFLTIIPLFTFSQVNTEVIIKSKYVQFYDWSEMQDDYILTDESWLDMTLDPYQDYYLVEIEDDGEIDKIWWEHYDQDLGFSGDSYFTEDGRKVVFNYDSQEIWFFYELNESIDQYDKLMIISKIDTFEK